VLEDATVEKLMKEIKMEIDKLEQLMESGIERKYMWLIMGRIHGMIKVLKMLK